VPAGQAGERAAAAAWAALLLGEVEAELGNRDAAEPLLEEALASGLPDVVALARIDVATYGDDLDRSERLLEEALADSSRRGDEEIRLLAVTLLAEVLSRRGHAARARRLLEDAIAIAAGGGGVGRSSPMVTARLGGLLAEQVSLAGRNRAELADKLGAAGKKADAADPAGKADPAGRTAGAADAAAGMGATAEAAGGTAEEAAGSAGRPTPLATLLKARTAIARPLAEANLGGLLISQGDTARARELLTSALNSGGERVAPIAKVSLGVIAIADGEHEQARELLEAARASGHPTAAPSATCYLALLAEEDDDPDAARALLTEVADGAAPPLAAMGLQLLGDTLAGRGDVDGARDAFERAIALDQPPWSPAAQVDLALVLGSGDPPPDAGRARELLAEIAGGDHGDQAPRASDLLGDLLLKSGNAVGAQAAYQRAIESGHPDWAPIAMIDLAMLHAGAGAAGAARARARLEQAEATGHRDQAPRAADLLGDLLASQSDPDGARAAYQRAIASEHPYWASIARTDLALLVAKGGDVEESVELLSAATASEDPRSAGFGRTMLAALQYDQGDHSLARSQLVEDADSPIVEVAVSALLTLTLVALEERNLDEAAATLERLLDQLGLSVPAAQAPPATADAATGDPAVAAVAADAGAAAGATADSAADPGDPGRRLLAYCDHLYQTVGWLDVVQMVLTPLLGEPLATQRPDLVADAARQLGQISFLAGSLDEAVDLLERALAATQSGPADAANTADAPGAPGEFEAMIRRYLGAALAQRGDRRAAREMLLPVLDTEFHRERGRALYVLGTIARFDGDHGAAGDYLRQAEREGSLVGDTALAGEARALLADADASRRALPGVPPSAVSPPPVVSPAPAVIPAPAMISPPAPGSAPAAAAAVAAASAPPPAPAEPAATAAPAPFSAPVLLALGEVALADGAHDEARDWLTRALDAGEAAVIARARLALAQSSLDRGAHGEARRLADLVRAAADPALSARAAALATEIPEAEWVARLTAETAPPPAQSST
jgi:tetratricopeptide (TPR) repeat protein